MKNKLKDLNNHLFEQLERLNDEGLTNEALEKEISRTDAMVKISTQIIENANVSLTAAKLYAESGASTRWIKSGLGHASERVTEKFYIKDEPEFAARQLLRVIEGGRIKRQELEQESGTKTGTTGK
jgi:hypothetical protein